MAHRWREQVWPLAALIALAGCRAASPDAGPGPLAPDAAAPEGQLDAGEPDGGRTDDGGNDAGGPDTGPADAGEPDGGPADGGAEARPLVVVTLNTHSFQEGPDSLAKLAEIGAGLAALDVDLVGLNEVMSGTFWSYDYQGVVYDGAALIKEALEDASGETYEMASFPFAHWDTGEQMANVLLSRSPILESEARALTTTDAWPAPGEARNVGYARTAVEGVGLVNVFVTHTWGWDSADTEAQILEVKAFMAEKFQGDEALDVLVGDLNTPATWPAMATWLEGPPFALIDTYALANPGVPGPTLLSGEHRIDFILAGEGWPWSEDPAYVESSRVFTGGELPVVSDHFGVRTVFAIPGD